MWKKAIGQTHTKSNSVRMFSQNDGNENFGYSRIWTEHYVKSTFSENAAKMNGVPWTSISESDIRHHHNSINENYECQIFVLERPIIASLSDVTEIIAVRDGASTVRIYPPFPINETGEAGGSLQGISIPEGISKVTSAIQIPSSAVTGAIGKMDFGEGTAWCRGFRMDVHDGSNPIRLLEILLENICQYTHQWWIRAPHNPFVGMKRLGAIIDRDFRVVEEIRYAGAGEIESSWHSTIHMQPNLAMGATLNSSSWRLACIHTGEGRRADQGILSFHDGIASYMANQDEKAIFFLNLSVEIMLNKYGVVVQKTGLKKMDKLIRTSSLIDGDIRNVVIDLLIDRNHVAHGRRPHRLGKNGRTLESYIDAVQKIVNKYLDSMPRGKWPSIMTMDI